MSGDLGELLSAYFNVGNSYYFTLKRDKSAFGMGTLELDDFSEFNEEDVDELASYLNNHGVVLQDADCKKETNGDKFRNLPDEVLVQILVFLRDSKYCAIKGCSSCEGCPLSFVCLDCPGGKELEWLHSLLED